jgi:hypothetical protein
MYCDTTTLFTQVSEDSTSACATTLNVKSSGACGMAQARDDINAFWTWLSNNKIAMCIVFMVLGLFIGFMGRKLFKVIVFIAGVLLVVGVVLVIFYTTFLKENQATWIGWVVLGCSILLGLLLGCLLVKMLKLGAFLVAAWGGFSLGLILYEALPLYKIDSQVFFWCFCIGLALICGVLALCLMDHVLILTTSLAGAYFFIAGIGLVAGHFQNPFTIVTERLNGHTVNIDPIFYVYLAGILVMWVLGALVQYKHRRTDNDLGRDPYNRLK